MEIKAITTTVEFDQLTKEFRTLNVWNFGPLADLEDEDANAVVMVALENGVCAAYLIADGRNLWHVETRSGFTGRGIARQLCEAAKISFAYEVCTDEGAALCEALGIEFDDAR